MFQLITEMGAVLESNSKTASTMRFQEVAETVQPQTAEVLSETDNPDVRAAYDHETPKRVKKKVSAAIIDLRTTAISLKTKGFFIIITKMKGFNTVSCNTDKRPAKHRRSPSNRTLLLRTTRIRGGKTFLARQSSPD